MNDEDGQLELIDVEFDEVRSRKADLDKTGTSKAANFQSLGVSQGRDFARQCDQLLESHGYRLHGSPTKQDIGVEIDREATSPSGTLVWFEYKGSVRGTRPGLMRTDTLKKAIANGALVKVLPDPPPFVVLTSHVPTSGSGLAMLTTAMNVGYLCDVIPIFDYEAVKRLKNF